MPHAARLGLYCAFVLLAACAGRPPQAPAPVAPVVSRPLLESQAQAANDVLFRAIGLVGTPYRYGGNTPAGGFDCSGLIGYVYRDAAGVALPRSTREMITLGSPNVARNALQPGDLIFFATAGGRQVSHAGIYVGEGRFVHAPRTGGTVRLDSLAKPYWQNSYLQAKRVLVTPSLAGGY